ncbi:MAG TPA: hypothetical protein VIL11_03845, partial [Limnochordales bacterium]
MTEDRQQPPLAAVGRSAVRLDGVAKATGSFGYGADLRLPGMLWGKIRRAEVPHALIRRVDVSAALEVPGVRAVLTGADVAGMRAGRFVRDEPILAHERVRYAGEPVAAVAADTPEAAEEAARRIVVEYEELPVITDPEQALREESPVLHPEWEQYWAAPVLRRSARVANHVTLTRGDVASAFARADLVVEDCYRTQYVHQASLEGRV